MQVWILERRQCVRYKKNIRRRNPCSKGGFKPKLVDRIKPKLSIIPVLWNNPAFGEFKLNVDGCSKGNPGNAGGGGILRDHLGHMVMAFTVYLGCCSNNSAEVQASKTGMRLCLDHGFNKLTIESDSLLVLQMTKGEISTAWQIREEVKEIQAMNTDGQLQFTHTFREGNIPADLLANLAERDRKKISSSLGL
ncbi:uncharacterized protein LOC142174367 [Nicotiana tabacum]|uniref:Uncharacterized protein LOC142174367 n=1 Tax=Nicotiana tabacum TaxID=4097 RepID=A0AC58TGA0_TOBAC